MAFEEIERVGPVTASRIPEDGVLVSSRAAMKGARYITVTIGGGGLAKAMVLRGEETRLTLKFGTDRDAGKVAMSVDVTRGAFPVKRQKSGAWKFTINAASADGLFALDFPAFTVPDVQVVSREGHCPMAVFAASEAMLAVED